LSEGKQNNNNAGALLAARANETMIGGARERAVSLSPLKRAATTKQQKRQLCIHQSQSKHPA
jgi:hypothetical protein